MSLPPAASPDFQTQEISYSPDDRSRMSGYPKRVPFPPLFSRLRAAFRSLLCVSFSSTAVLSLTVAAADPQPVLVRNINTQAGPGTVIPRLVTAVESKVFFTAVSPMHGEELWVSDGTLKGTRMVKDIRPGLQGSSIVAMTASGKRLFFSADDGAHGHELWVSDGTPAGTRMVADILEGHSSTLAITAMKGWRNGVIFTGWGNVSGMALWWSDGTAAGTTLLKKLPQGFYTDSAASMTWAVLGKELCFHFYEGYEKPAFLWKTDGTTAGTRQVRQFAQPRSFTNCILGTMGTHLYLCVNEGEDGEELWKSDGTAEGTLRVRDINPGPAASSPVFFAATKDRACFMADTPQNGSEIWITDGTYTGTQVLLEQTPGAESSNWQPLAMFGDSLITSYIYGPEGENALISYNFKTKKRTEIWRTTSDYPVSNVTVAGSKIYFTVAQGSGETFLYVSNGTAAGTQAVLSADAQPFTVLQDIPPVAAGTQLFFLASISGAESPGFWRSNGTPAGTYPLKDVLPIDESSLPRNFVVSAGVMYFSASDGIHGEELWCSDGTAAGTRLVKDINPGPSGSAPHQLTAMGGIIHFTATTGLQGMELWQSDSSAEGTFAITDFDSGDVLHVTAMDPRIYCFTQPSTQGGKWKLWHSSGVEMAVLAELKTTAFPYVEPPQAPVVMNGRLYFTGGNSLGNAPALYYADSGAVPVNDTEQSFDTLAEMKDLTVGPTPGVPGVQSLYFIGKLKNNSSRALCRYTGGSTFETLSSASFSAITGLQRTGDFMVFKGVSPGNPGLASVWRSDGTVAGTTALLENMTRIDLVAAAGGDLYLSQMQGSILEFGRFIVSSGQWFRLMYDLADTPKVRDVFGDTVFFSLPYGDSRHNLWQSRGTPETTRQISGVVMHEETGMTMFNDRLYLSALGTGIGQELQVLDFTSRLNVYLYRDGIMQPLTGNQPLDFGKVHAGRPRTEELYVRNDSLYPLTDIGLSLTPEGGRFSLDQHTIPLTVAPGDWFHFGLSLAPDVAGKVQGALEITGSLGSGDTVLKTQALEGTGLAETAPPIITSRFDSPLLVREGQDPVSASATYAGSFDTASRVWKRGKTIVSTTDDLNLASLTPKEAGLYTFTLTTERGTAVSSPLAVAVVATTPEELQVKEDSAFTVESRVTAPAGCTLSYQWILNSSRLTDYGRVRGSRTSKLQISSMRSEDQGVYSCEVTVTYKGFSTTGSDYSSIAVWMLPKAAFTLVDNEAPFSYVGEEVEYSVTVTGADRLIAKGLPPGLTMDAEGLITGTARIAQLRPYLITIVGINSSGSRTQIIPWTVRPVIPAGSYETPVGVMTEVAGKPVIGGHLWFTATTGGSVTGQLRHEQKTYRFTGVPQIYQFYANNVQAELTIPRGPGEEPYNLFFDVGTGIEATLSVGQEWSQTLYPLRNRFTAQDPAGPLAGTYTWQMENLSDHGPQGRSFATATLSKTGILTWKGKMADGTAVVGSSTVLGSWTDSTAMLFHIRQELYKGTGIMTGTFSMLAPTDLIPATHLESGNILWSKAALLDPAQERTYGEGFNTQGSATGTLYQPPAVGQRVLSLANATDNAVFSLTGSAIPEGSINQFFTVTAKNALAKLPALDATHVLKSLAISPKTGTFKGTAIITTPNEVNPSKPVQRTAAFEGVLIPWQRSGAGFILLPALPAESQSASTTPIHSVEVLWGPPAD